MFATPAWLKKLEKLDLSGQPWQRRVKKPAREGGEGGERRGKERPKGRREKGEEKNRKGRRGRGRGREDKR